MMAVIRRFNSVVVVIVVACLCVVSTVKAEKLIHVNFNDDAGNQSLVNKGTIAVTGVMVTNVIYSASRPTVNRDGYCANFTNEVFDGENHISFGSLAEFNTEITNLTVCLWLRPQNYRAWQQRVINKGSRWQFNLNSEYKPSLEIEGYPSPSLLSAGIKKGHWTFVAVTYNGTLTADNIKCYAGDGISLTAPTTNTLNRGSISGNSDELWFGNIYPNDNRPYPGMMDDVRIYNEILDAAALEAIMKEDDAPSSSAPAPEVGKLVQMDFNTVLGGATLENRGTMLVDAEFGTNASYSTEVPAINGKGYSLSLDSTTSTGTNYVSLFNGTEYTEFNDDFWQLSVCMWINTGNNMSYAPRVLSYQGSTGSHGWEFKLSNYGKVPQFTANGYGTGWLGSNLVPGRWEFVAVTYDGTLSTNNMICYQGTDSTLTVTTNTPPSTIHGKLNANNSNMRLWIGDKSYPGGSVPFHGQLDNVRIYNRVLDKSRLEEIMAFDDVLAKGTLLIIR